MESQITHPIALASNPFPFSSCGSHQSLMDRWICCFALLDVRQDQLYVYLKAHATPLFTTCHSIYCTCPVWRFVLNCATRTYIIAPTRCPKGWPIRTEYGCSKYHWVSQCRRSPKTSESVVFRLEDLSRHGSRVRNFPVNGNANFTDSTYP